jgi:hypothetical protein
MPAEEEDADTLAAIDEAIAQLQSGEGIPLEELRKEFEQRRSSCGAGWQPAAGC